MAAAQTRFVWTDSEVELLLSVTNQYKVNKRTQSVHWECVHSKHEDILALFVEQYRGGGTDSDFPHKKEDITEARLIKKLKGMKSKMLKHFQSKYRGADDDNGRRSGFGRVVFLHFELCEQVWGASPAGARMLPSGVQTADFVVPEAATTESDTDTTQQEMEESSDSPEPGPSNLAVKQRRDLLQAKLQGHRQDRLKRKRPVDTQLQHAIEEDVKMKKRILDVWEASELQSNENMKSMANTLDTNMKSMANTLETLTRSIVEGITMMRQSNMQHAPQLFNMSPQPYEHHSGQRHYGSRCGTSPHNSSATRGQGTYSHNSASATPGTYLHTLTPARPGTYPHDNSSFNTSAMDTLLGNGTDSE